MNSIIRLFLLMGIFGLAGCKKDDFPVPPASTVPLFTFTVDNNGFAPATVVFTNTSIVPERAGTVAYNWILATEQPRQKPVRPISMP
jgi:hypothetical protein